MKRKYTTVVWIYCMTSLYVSCTKDLDLNDIGNPDIQTEPLDTKKEITEFLFLDFENNQLRQDIIAAIDEEKLEIRAVVPYETELEVLKPRISIPQTATISPGRDEFQDFTNPVEYIVTAEDGSQTTYKVVVSSVPFTQKEVLEAIYESNPGNTLAWDVTNEDISTWEGVTVESGNIVELILPEKDLSVLPPEIGSLSYLNKLDVQKNKIITIPSEIANMRSNLKFLQLASNNISKIPESLFELILLEDLRLFSNKLTAIPEDIVKLKNLKVISFSKNEIETIPEEVMEMPQLTGFFIQFNKLTTMPDNLEISKLERLGISGNPFTTFPDQIFQLSKLKNLYIAALELSEVPEGLSTVKNIELLDVSENLLTTVDPVITNLTTLKRLYLNKNQLTEIPVEISNLQNLELLRIQENLLTVLPKAVCDIVETGTEIEKDDTAVCETE